MTASGAVQLADAVRHDVELALLADEVLSRHPECLYDPELHDGPADPDSESPADRVAREQVAAEVCAGCEVRGACLDYALQARPRRGVWAGLTAFEVDALADALGIPSHETADAADTAAEHASRASVPSQSKENGRGTGPQPPSTQPGAAVSPSHEGDALSMPAAGAAGRSRTAPEVK